MNNNSDSKRKCRFCLKIIGENDFNLTEEVIREIIDALLLPRIMDLNISKSPAICKACMRKLQAAFDFKTICLDTEDLLFPFKDNDKDLLNIYLKTKNRTRTKTKLSICRLCFKPTGSTSKTFDQLQQKNPDLADVLTKHFPEMALDHFDRPTVCSSCIGSLRKFSNLLTVVWETEKYIKDSIEIHSINNNTDTANLQAINSNLVIKQEPNENEVNNVSCEKERTTKRKMGIKEESMENATEVKCLNKEEIHIEKEEISGTFEAENGSINKRRRPRGKYKRHKPVIIKIFTCEVCPYRTKTKSHFERHGMVHRNASEIQTYQCDMCDFKTKHERYLAKHALTHMEESARPAYKCEFCPFKSFHKETYKIHKWGHTNPSEIYKCEHCQFQTVYKSSYEYHMLSHKADSEVTLLQCHLCDFKSKHRLRLVQHTRIHRKLSDSELFHCHICTYKGRAKKCLQRHLQTHKPSSEVKMYQCPECSYETRHKYVLKIHSVVHKSASELTMFECDRCSFQTKFKTSLRGHKKIHEKNDKMLPIK